MGVPVLLEHLRKPFATLGLQVKQRSKNNKMTLVVFDYISRNEYNHYTETGEKNEL